MRRTVRGSAGKGALSAGRCRRWGVGRGMSGPGAPGAPRSPAAPAPRRPWLSAAPAAPPRRSGLPDLSQPRTLISGWRLARRQPLPGRQGHHWGCTGGKKQLRTRETAHAPLYSATQDRLKSGSSRFCYLRPIVNSQFGPPPHKRSRGGTPRNSAPLAAYNLPGSTPGWSRPRRRRACRGGAGACLALSSGVSASQLTPCAGAASRAPGALKLRPGFLGREARRPGTAPAARCPPSGASRAARNTRRSLTKRKEAALAMRLKLMKKTTMKIVR